jgi:hypothetical protein
MKRNTILIIVFVILLLFLSVWTNQIRELFTTSASSRTALAIQQGILQEKLNSTLIPLPNNKKGILVHERELFGYSGQTPITITTTTESMLAKVYNPFGYGTPTTVRSNGMTRQYRLYVVYTDNLTGSGRATTTNTEKIELRLCKGDSTCSGGVTLELDKAGLTTPSVGTTTSSEHRDGFTDLKSPSDFTGYGNTDTMTIFGKITSTNNTKKAVIRKIVLQVIDVMP